MNWKPRTIEKKAIRYYAAKSAHCRPGQVRLDIGERCDDENYSANLLAVGGQWDKPGQILEGTDLHDYCSWQTFTKYGVELVEGRAVIDVYVIGRDEDAELLTNIQIWIDTVEGKPRIVRFSGTSSPDWVISTYQDFQPVV